MLFRMSIRDSKLVIWILNISAILVIMILFISIYMAKMDGKFDSQEWGVFQAALEKGVKQSSEKKKDSIIDINSYAAIWSAPINGVRKRAVETGPEERVDVVKIVPIEDIVQVRIILMSSVPEERRVRLTYPKNEDGEEKAFKLEIWNKEGDPLRHPYDKEPYLGKILKITEHEVVFSYNGKEEAMKPDYAIENEGGIAARRVDGKSFNAREEAPKYEPPAETREVSEGHFHVSRKESDDVRTNYERHLKQVTLAAVKDPRTGKTQLKLSAIEPSSLAYKRGFRKGDMLISINGYPVHNKAGAVNYFKEHPNEGTYTVEIDRMGTRTYKTYTVPQD